MSSPLCPKCETELKEDFGITDCPGCGTVCFIGMDDSVQVQGEEPASSVGADALVDEDVVSEETVVEQSDEHVESDLTEEDLVEDAYGDGIEENIGEPDEEFQEYEAEDLAEEESYVEEPVDQIEEEENSLDNFEENVVSENQLDAPLGVADFLNELEIFAADADVKDFESELYFDVKISGVETAEMKDLLIETVADSRLDLTEEGLLEDFIDEEGALYLSQIPYVRVVVIYKRILSMGLKVEWLQKEVHELEVEDAEGDEAVEETY